MSLQFDFKRIKNLRKFRDDVVYQKEFQSELENIYNNLNRILISIPSEKFDYFYLQQVLNQLQTLIDTSKEKLTGNFGDVVGEYYKKLIQELSSKISKIGVILTPTLTPETIIGFTNVSASLVKSIPDELRDKIEQQLRLSALAGDTLFNIQKKLAGELEGYKGVYTSAEKRAKIIAMNEISRAYSQIDWETIQAIGKKLEGIARVYKIWKANKDERTRKSHLEADNQKVLWNEPFEVGGEKLMYPLDPAGSPENTINCRCWLSMEIELIEEKEKGLEQEYEKFEKKVALGIEEIVKKIGVKDWDKFKTNLSNIINKIDFSEFKTIPSGDKELYQYSKKIEELVKNIIKQLGMKVGEYNEYKKFIGQWVASPDLSYPALLQVAIAYKLGKLDNLNPMYLEFNIVKTFLKLNNVKGYENYTPTEASIEKVKKFQEVLPSIMKVMEINKTIISKITGSKEVNVWRFITDKGVFEKLKEFILNSKSGQEMMGYFLVNKDIDEKKVDKLLSELEKVDYNFEVNTNPVISTSLKPSVSVAGFGYLPVNMNVKLDYVLSSFMVNSDFNEKIYVDEKEFVVFNPDCKVKMSFKTLAENYRKIGDTKIVARTLYELIRRIGYTLSEEQKLKFIGMVAKK